MAMSRVLESRIRATDDAGLLGSDRVGVVLPETPADGAWKLADDILKLLPETMRRPECDVYSYPSEPVEPAPREVATGGTATHVAGDRRVAVHCEALSRPMHAFFLQPLPRWKRAIDILGAAVAIVLAMPLLAIVSAAIKLTSPGPVIFKQKRDTIGGRQFTIYKFRTMTVDAELRQAALRQHSEQDGPAFKIAKDPRVTRLGRFLRVSSIDELPQLFNVLAGDMTLVGPRAMDSRESRCCEPWQRRRLDVTAGLTCIWQVRGRSSVTFVEWMRMDIRYIQSRSLANDVKLIVQTVPAVLRQRGAC